MSMQMDRVSNRNSRLSNNNINPLASIGQVDKVRRIAERRSSNIIVLLKKSRVLPVDEQRSSIHSPSEEVVGVGGDTDCLFISDGNGTNRLGEEGNEVGG